jgi:hypothetical protein
MLTEGQLLRRRGIQLTRPWLQQAASLAFRHCLGAMGLGFIQTRVFDVRPREFCSQAHDPPLAVSAGALSQDDLTHKDEVSEYDQS